MVFDSDRFHLQQMASARADSLPSDVWIDRCCSHLSKHLPDMAPDGVVALAKGLWLSHWFDDPETTADQAAKTSPIERYADPASDNSSSDGSP